MVHPKLACWLCGLFLFFAPQMFSQDILLGFTINPPNPSSQCETTIEIEYVTQDGCNSCWLANYYLSGSNTWVFDFECIAIQVIPCPTNYATTTEQISLGQLPIENYAVLEYLYGIPQEVIGTFLVVDIINITSENGTANMNVDGNVINVTDWPVINSGNTPTGNFSACIYLSEDTDITSSDYLIHIEDGLSVGKNATSIKDFSIDLDTLSTLPPSGNYYMGIILDCDDEVNESDETDNIVEFVGGGYPQIEIGAPVNCQANDYDAATDFYNQTNGPTWTSSTGWFSNNPISGFWFGITQDGSGCVTQLSLPNNNLSGDIPDAVGGFSELQSLSLVGNGLTGTVPDTLASLANVTGIFLGQNELTGTVPEAILELPTLTEFNIDFNNIDSLPPISNPGLSLWVNDNQLTFDDILPTIGSVDNIIYSPQAVVDITDTIYASVGDNVTLDLVFDDTVSTNEYFWNSSASIPISSGGIVGVNELTFQDVQVGNSGEYSCLILNSNAPDLTLQTTAITLIVTSGCQMNCLTPPPFELDNNGEVTIMAVELLENNGAACPSGDFELEIFNSVGTSLGAAAASQMMNCSHLGETFTFRVTDVNTGEFCEGSLTVEDNDPPTLSCLNSYTVSIPPGGTVQVNLSELIVSSSDNCTLNPELSFSQTSLETVLTLTCDELGSYGALMYGTDEQGNESQCWTGIAVENNDGNCVTPQPDTLFIFASDEMAEVGEQFCFDVTVQNFTIIESMQFSMSWNADAMSFNGVQNFGLPQMSVTNFGQANAGIGELTTSWFDGTLNGVTLNDSDVIFQACFTPLCASLGNYDFEFLGTPVAIEVSNSDDQIVPTQFQSGTLQITGETTLPVPSCLAAYSVEVNVLINAVDLDDGSTDNCTTNLDFSFSADIADNMVSFNCGQLGQNTVEVWVTDEYGNQGICMVDILVEDNAGVCGTPCPANTPISDDCPDLIDLGEAPFCSSNCFFNNIDATQSDIGNDNLPPCFVNGTERDVWFSFVGSASFLDYKITVTGLSDGMGSSPMIMPQVALYRGDCEFDGMVFQECASASLNENEVSLEAPGLDPGVTYFLRINDWSENAIPNEGTFQICIEESDCAGLNLMGEEIYTGCTGDGYEVTVNGTIYGEANPTGTEILTSFSGCDSTVTIDLLFLDDLVGEEIYMGCSGDGYEVTVNGSIYNEANPIGTETLTTSSGCDSIVNINLQFLNTLSGEENYLGCVGDGYEVTVNGTIYNEANPSGTETLTASSGCDSIVNINLQFLNILSGEEIYTGCVNDGYQVTVNGSIYNEANPSGTETLPSSSGCDSVVTVTLVFLEEVTGEELYTGCSDDGYQVTVNGTTYNETNPSGTETLTASSGCDSVVNISLNYLSPSTGMATYTGCSGDGYSIEINGTVYDESNQTGTEVLTAANGCDSIVMVDLIFNEVYFADYSNTLCTGTSVEINGTVYDESNPSGEEVFQTVNGCDSTVNISLDFNDVVTENLLVSLCSGESLMVGNDLFDESNPSGTVLFENGSIDGCDSVVQVTLEFYEEISEEISQTLCAGESIEVNGTIYDELNPSGTQTMMSGAGCDSTVSISLDFIFSESDFEQNICPGESIFINGNEYGENNPSGREILAGASYLGCDSVVNISLTILATVAEIPNVFTPNGDGVNDTFDPLSFYEINGCTNTELTAAELTILSRAGEAIYRSGENYVPWRGINGTGENGTEVPDGTYYYFLKLTSASGDEEVKGAINVLRGN